MNANDCHDPPKYWTIHGLWYDHRVFLFQPGKEKANFVPGCLVIWFCWVGFDGLGFLWVFCLFCFVVVFCGVFWRS